MNTRRRDHMGLVDKHAIEVEFPMSYDGEYLDWAVRFREVVKGWLFDDVEGPLPEILVLPMENPELHDREAWDQMIEVDQRCRSITTGTGRDGQRVGILTAKLGGPAVAMTVDAASGHGARFVFGVGYCGGLARHLTCGDLVIPVAAIADDGTSRGYVAERFPAVADHSLTNALLTAGITRPHEGIVWSIDAVLKQDAGFLRRAAELGIDAVDMETAALFTVARLTRMRACCVLVVSDHPANGLLTDDSLLAAGVRSAMALVKTGIASAIG